MTGRIIYITELNNLISNHNPQMKRIHLIPFVTVCLLEVLRVPVSAGGAVHKRKRSKYLPRFSVRQMISDFKTRPSVLNQEDDPTYDVSKCTMSFYPPRATKDDEDFPFGRMTQFPDHECKHEKGDKTTRSWNNCFRGEGDSSQIDRKYEEHERHVFKSIFSSLAGYVYWFPLVFFAGNLLSCIYDDKSGLDDDEPSPWLQSN